MNDVALTSAFVGGIVAFILMAVFIFYLLTVLAGWRIFTKAGIAGWKALIPIYNEYLLFKLSNCTGYFWIIVVLTAIISILNPTGADAETLSATTSVIISVVSIVIFVFGCLFSKKLANSFGRGTGFAIGLVLFPNIFQLILAYGPAKYRGNR